MKLSLIQPELSWNMLIIRHSGRNPIAYLCYPAIRKLIAILRHRLIRWSMRNGPYETWIWCGRSYMLIICKLDAGAGVWVTVATQAESLYRWPHGPGESEYSWIAIIPKAFQIPCPLFDPLINNGFLVWSEPWPGIGRHDHKTAPVYHFVEPARFRMTGFDVPCLDNADIIGHNNSLLSTCSTMTAWNSASGLQQWQNLIHKIDRIRIAVGGNYRIRNIQVIRIMRAAYKNDECRKEYCGFNLIVHLCLLFAKSISKVSINI